MPSTDKRRTVYGVVVLAAAIWCSMGVGPARIYAQKPAAVNSAAAAEQAQAQACDVPESLIPAASDLTRVSNEIKDRHRLDISVVGSGSSALSGPDGARFAYPAQLEQALRERLPGNEIKVTAHVPSRQTTADMAAGLPKILSDDRPALVI